MRGEIKTIDYKTAIAFLLPRHYSGRKPNIMYGFGWYIKGELVAVCTFGKPASPPLCVGVCGKEYAPYVLELNRLCRVDDLEYQLSAFVSACLRRLGNKIVISYADTAMNHVGKIYQACNFIYTGASKARTDKYVPDGKHSRHYDKDAVEVFRKVRSSKHRYIYFCGVKGRCNMAKEFKNNLNYPIMPYPKGESEKYKLGDFIQDKIIRK